MRLHASAPARIDLAGGTLDLWPLYLFHPGALTLNVAITRYAHCRLEPRRGLRILLADRDTGQREAFTSPAELARRQRFRLPLLAEIARTFNPLQGFSLTTWSEVPAGAGLGGSSALAIAICAAFTRWLGARLAPADWIPLARDLEARVLGVPAGEQDHYPAVFGGTSAIRLEPGGTRREALRVPLAELEARLLLAYTGKPRRSGINNWEVFKRHIDGDVRLRRCLGDIARISAAMRAALEARHWNRAGRLLGAEWQARRKLAPAITTPFIDRLIRLARRVGAQAGKVCGAGGGGCVVFVVPPDRRARVTQALAAAGATLLPFRVARAGVRVERLP